MFSRIPNISASRAIAIHAPPWRMEHPRAAALIDRRPLYPETLAIGVPRGTRERIRARARDEGTTVAALARQAIERLLGHTASPRES